VLIVGIGIYACAVVYTIKAIVSVQASDILHFCNTLRS
jgi:hypothetical protein